MLMPFSAQNLRYSLLIYWLPLSVESSYWIFWRSNSRNYKRKKIWNQYRIFGAAARKAGLGFVKKNKGDDNGKTSQK